MAENRIPISQNNVKAKDIRIDIIRSLSMMYIVFICHYCDYLPLIRSEPLRILTNCVLTSFFFISGYLFGQHSHFQTGKDFYIFYKKRILRIIPLFVLALVSFYLCGRVSFWDAVKTLLGISAFSLPHTKTLWFMNIIIIFYFLTPILLYRDKKEFFFLFAGLFCLFCVLLYIKKYDVDIRLLYYFPAYCIGLFWHHFRVDLFISNRVLRYSVSAVSFVIFFAIYVFVILKNEYNKHVEATLLLLFIIAIEAILWNLFLTQGCILLSRFSKTFSFLSYSSFSVYLFHRPLLQLLVFLLNRNHISADSWVFIASFYIAIPILIFIAFFIQKAYDGIVRCCTCRMQ